MADSSAVRRFQSYIFIDKVLPFDVRLVVAMRGVKEENAVAAATRAAASRIRTMG
jgi:hypothetical protein